MNERTKERSAWREDSNGLTIVLGPADIVTDLDSLEGAIVLWKPELSTTHAARTTTLKLATILTAIQR